MTKDVVNIAEMPGDFIGKEVVAEEKRVLNAAGEKYGFTIKTTHYPHGGEHYVKTGELVTDSIIGELKGHDAIMFGAVGHPDLNHGEVEGGVLLRMRFDLDQYINLRPSKLYAGVDAPIRKLHPELKDGYKLIVVREGVAGIYRGNGSLRTLPDGKTLVATEVMEYSSQDVERVLDYAFGVAINEGEERNPLPLTMGFKSNVLKNVSAGVWQPVFNEIAAKEEHSLVKSNYAHIDALVGPWLINNPLPENGWVIVTGNMFGDILTDLTASLFGGMGVGASGCINPHGTSMFEPIHGSSPKDYGKGNVSPIAAILSGAMMLEHIGKTDAAKGIEAAVTKVLASGRIPNLTTASGVPTQKQTEMVLDELLKEAA